MTRMYHIIVMLCFVWQCNNKTDDTQPTTTDPHGSSEENGSNNCPQLALAAFEQHIQPAIDASCGVSGCHGEGDGEASDRIRLLQTAENGDNAIINRAQMVKHKYRGRLLIEPGVLLGKIGGGDHEGGNQIDLGHITEEGITVWAEAERKCSNND